MAVSRVQLCSRLWSRLARVRGLKGVLRYVSGSALRCTLAISTAFAVHAGHAVHAAQTAQASVPQALAATNVPPGCALAWQIQWPDDTAPRQLWLDLWFDAGGRSRSTLRLPAGWDGLTEAGPATSPAASTSDPAAGAGTVHALRLRPVADEPTLRTLDHAPGERVHLRWQIRLPQAVVLDPANRDSTPPLRWLALTGQSVLPMPDEIDDRNPPSACLGLVMTGPSTNQAGRAMADAPSAQLPAAASATPATRPMQWVSSFGAGQGPQTWLRLPGGAAAVNTPLRAQVQRALMAGGDLQVHELTTDGQTVSVALPPATLGATGQPWRFDAAALAQASAQAVAQQRQFWGDKSHSAPPLLVLVVPSAAGPGTPNAVQPALAWQQAVLLPASPDLTVPGPGLDALITEALAQYWMRDRFGPVAYVGRGDAAQRDWFSLGLAHFFAHRMLLLSGQRALQDQADALTQGLNLDAQSGSPSAGMQAVRGEWLAMQWHTALRNQGLPGLDTVMKRLLLSPAQSRHEGPQSAPLATHRLVAALRPALGDAPLHDIGRVIARGEALGAVPGALGPCFVVQPGPPLAVQVPAQAMAQPACLGWLGLGAEALSAARAQGAADPTAVALASSRAASQQAKGQAHGHGKVSTRAGGRAGKLAKGHRSQAGAQAGGKRGGRHAMTVGANARAGKAAIGKAGAKSAGKKPGKAAARKSKEH